MAYSFEFFNASLTSRLNKSGPVYRLSFEVDRDCFDHLMNEDMANGIWTCQLLQHNANGLIEEEQPEKKDNNFWHEYIKKGFFYNPDLLNALGGDKAYQAFLREQPSALSGNYSEYVNGVGKCVVAHVRRANDSGTGYKPLFSAIPLTFEEHQLQHQHGEEHLKERSWWDKQVARYIIQFVKHRLCELFLCESLNDIELDHFHQWLYANNIGDLHVKE